MGKVWYAFSTIFTLLGLSAGISAAILLKLGYINQGVLTRAFGQERVLSRESEKGKERKSEKEVEKKKSPENKPQSLPSKLTSQEIRTWIQRLETLQRAIDWREAEVVSELEISKRQRKSLKALSSSLLSLFSVLFPEEKLPTADQLLGDPSLASELKKKIEERRSAASRLPELVKTIEEMREEEAALLIGEGLNVDLACEVLERVNQESRAAILGYLAKRNPAKAGEIFRKMAQSAETQGG